MIFPKVRISDLEADTAKKKEAFQTQKENFISSAKEKLHPVTLLKENKKAVFAGLLSLVAAGKIFGKISKTWGPKLKGNMIFSVLKAAWFWKLIDFSYNIYKLSGPKPKRSER